VAMELRNEARLPASAHGNDLEFLPLPPAHFAIGRILTLAQDHLGMDVAFISEFARDQEVIRVIHGDGESFGLRRDGSLPLEHAYGQRVADGRLPNLVPDVQNDPRVVDLPLTDQARIGSYIGVPIRFSDGRMYGSLSCMGHQPDATLRERDVRFMKMLGGLVAEELERQERDSRRRHERLERINRVLEGEAFEMVFQPIVDLRVGEIVGFEALARFDGDPARPPDVWFAEAADVGLQVELELAAIKAALVRLPDLSPKVYLSVNVSPETVISPRFLEVVAETPPARLVIEVTEHARVEDYGSLNESLHFLRAGGVRLAIDDVGAGFASLRHILRSEPDIIKLDMTLTRDIDSDPVRRALATSLLSFCTEIDATITAEGIETAGEMEALRELGVGFGQGFYLAYPGPLPSANGSAGPILKDT
jgi:EAL domain-containing protein (putative c-di-GMP-specific phosphodiesterase class I)